jgi:O-methyltransferase
MDNLSPKSNDRYSDPIRIAALKLCALEIKKNNTAGSVAELGVYRGNFAARINAAFPDRRLILFDTFSGFDADELKADFGDGADRMHGKFSQTTVDEVLSKMDNPARCDLRVGIFPATSVGLESEDFAFVSIDADLFAPIYEGLKFFYPHLSPGGYIFVDDFNNPDWPGTAQAVRRFCSENKVAFMMLPDAHGTAVIAKHI